MEKQFGAQSDGDKSYPLRYFNLLSSTLLQSDEIWTLIASLACADVHIVSVIPNGTKQQERKKKKIKERKSAVLIATSQSGCTWALRCDTVIKFLVVNAEVMCGPTPWYSHQFSDVDAEIADLHSIKYKNVEPR
ncbi:hypothetical protein Sjap_000986 [Stephania japonica]|uniref:Uncharacterized protein n=1 Tax=Stephania japonica TaxID=461633 RepID=A0AAP0PUL4_9MAGN